MNCYLLSEFSLSNNQDYYAEYALGRKLLNKTVDRLTNNAQMRGAGRILNTPVSQLASQGKQKARVAVGRTVDRRIKKEVQRSMNGFGIKAIPSSRVSRSRPLLNRMAKGKIARSRFATSNAAARKASTALVPAGARPARNRKSSVIYVTNR